LSEQSCKKNEIEGTGREGKGGKLQRKKEQETKEREKGLGKNVV